MLWERKIKLEREMAEVMDPSVGTDVVGAMRREVHRMQLRLGDLGRLQERLIADMERSISKRDTINTKVGPEWQRSAVRRGGRLRDLPGACWATLPLVQATLQGMCNSDSPAAHSGSSACTMSSVPRNGPSAECASAALLFHPGVNAAASA